MESDLDEMEALGSSARKLAQAGSAAEQRAAIITWLQGAIVVAGDAVPGSEAPGRLLEAALAALDEGHILPVLRGASRTTTTASAVAQARARAIAALDWLQHVEGLPVPVAGRAIDDAIGMPAGTVVRWRETSRSARKLNVEAAALVPGLTTRWQFLATLPATLTGGDSVMTVISAELSNDWVIHRSA